MAKGDKNKMQNVVNTQGTQAQSGITNKVADTSMRTSALQDYYNKAVAGQGQDYSDIMGGYKGFRSSLPPGNEYLSNFLKTGVGQPNDIMSPVTSRLMNFADTGGVDANAIRARALMPVHGIGDMLTRKIQQQAAIRGANYSPNTTAALAKAARDTAYSAGDTATNAEGMIADLQARNKLGGMQALSSALLGARGQDLDAIAKASGLDLSALGGMRDLYGTTPAQANMFGQQMLGSVGQELQTQGLQNQLMQLILSGQFDTARTPSTAQNVLGNISTGLDFAKSLGGPFANIFR